MSNATIAAVIVTPLLFYALLLYSVMKLSEAHAVLKHFTHLLGFPFLWASLHLCTVAVVEFYPTFLEMQETIAFYSLIAGYVFVIITTYWFIYLIYLLFKNMSRAKQEELEGIEYGE